MCDFVEMRFQVLNLDESPEKRMRGDDLTEGFNGNPMKIFWLRTIVFLLRFDSSVGIKTFIHSKRQKKAKPELKKSRKSSSRITRKIREQKKVFCHLFWCWMKKKPIEAAKITMLCCMRAIVIDTERWECMRGFVPGLPQKEKSSFVVLHTDLNFYGEFLISKWIWCGNGNWLSWRYGDEGNFSAMWFSSTSLRIQFCNFIIGTSFISTLNVGIVKNRIFPEFVPAQHGKIGDCMHSTTEKEFPSNREGWKMFD